MRNAILGIRHQMRGTGFCTAAQGGHDDACSIDLGITFTRYIEERAEVQQGALVSIWTLGFVAPKLLFS